jgi:hypothetical protein
VDRVVLAEDLDAPVRRIADDLAVTGRDHARRAHARTLRPRPAAAQFIADAYECQVELLFDF